MSRSLSLTLLDSNGEELLIQTSMIDPIEFFISRDPLLIFPSMIFVDVLAMQLDTLDQHHRQIFNLYLVNLTTDVSMSLHLDFRALNVNLSYLLIYRFDQSPQLNDSISLIDGWTCFCSSLKSDDGICRYFLDNDQTSTHRSLIFGLREMNETETDQCCRQNASTTQPPITDRPFHFTSNYYFRTYQSSCAYLDENHLWQTDGLRVSVESELVKIDVFVQVGPLTDENRTHCYSTHLTTFASGLFSMPAPQQWNDLDLNDEMREEHSIGVIMVWVLFVSIPVLISSIVQKQEARKVSGRRNFCTKYK